MNYDRFLIHVHPDRRLTAVLPNERPVSGLSLPTDPGLTAAIEAALERLTDPDGLAQAADFEALGTSLFEYLFPEKLATLLTDRFLDIRDDPDRGLKILLQLDPQAEATLPEATWPWEFLFLPETRDFFATNQSLTFSRLVAIDDHPPRIRERDLRILVVTASPSDVVGVVRADIPNTIRDLQKRIKNIELVEVLDQPTASDLRQAIDQVRPHILHFIGHGHFDEEAGGLLALLSSDGTAAWYPAQEFVRRFSGHPPRLVVLQACESGQQDTSRGLVGVAAGLARLNVSVVVGMQYEILQWTAIHFVDEFYRSLANGFPVDAAVQRGRDAIATAEGLDGIVRGHSFRDFGVPVLFARTAEALELISAADLHPPALDLSEKETRRLRSRYAEIVRNSRQLNSTDLIAVERGVASVSIEDFYVEPALVGQAHPLDILGHSQRRLAVLGEPGIGKTTLLKYLNLAILESEDQSSQGLWPLYIRLDRYAGQASNPDLLEFGLADLFSGSEEPELVDLLRSKRDSGSLLLLLDGLDEVGHQRDAVVEAYRHYDRFLVVARPGGGFLLGQDLGGTLEIERFDLNRIAAFVQNWHRLPATGAGSFDGPALLEQLQQDDSLFEIGQNPQFLALICYLWSQGERDHRSRAQIFAHAWQSLLDQSLKEYGRGERIRIEQALRSLAYEGFSAESAPRYAFNELEVYRLWEQIFGSDAVDGIFEAVSQSGLLLEQNTYPRKYRFLYRAFQEFGAADHFVQQPDWRASLQSIHVQPTWREILPFAAGLLGLDPARHGQLRVLLRALLELESPDLFGLTWALIADCMVEVPGDPGASLGTLSDQIDDGYLQNWIDSPWIRGNLLTTWVRWKPLSLLDRFESIVVDADLDAVTRGGAALCLGAYHTPRAIEILARLLREDGNEQVRASAALALTRVPGERVSEVLIAALADPAPSVRAACLGALTNRGERDSAARILADRAGKISILETEDQSQLGAYESIVTIAALASLRPEAALPVLLNVLGSPLPVEAKAYALSILVSAQSQAAIWPVLQMARDDQLDAALRGEAISALIGLGTPLGMDEVRRAMEQKDEILHMKIAANLSIFAELGRSGLASLTGVDYWEGQSSGLMIQKMLDQLADTQIRKNRGLIDSLVEERGRESVIAEARADFEKAPAAEAEADEDRLDMLQILLAAGQGAGDRVAALEILHTLDPDAQRLLDAISDAELNVAMRAIFLIQRMDDQITVDDWLEQFRKLQQVPFSRRAVLMQAVPARLRHLCELFRLALEGENLVLGTLWQLASFFDIRLYRDGRIVLADGIEFIHCSQAVERLEDHLQLRDIGVQLDAAHRESLVEAAQLAYDQARHMEPQDTEGWLIRGDIHFLFDNYEAAIESFSRALLGGGPVPAGYIFERGVSHFHLEAYPQAIEDLQRALESGMVNWQVYTFLGESYLRSDQFAAAEETFSLAIDLGAARAVVYSGRSQARQELGRALEALADAGEAAILDPDSDWNRKQLRRLIAEQEELDEPIAILERVVQANAGQQHFRELLAELLLRDSNFSKAWVHYEVLHFMNPNNPAYLEGRARSSLGQGDLDQAIDDFQAARGKRIMDGTNLLRLLAGGPIDASIPPDYISAHVERARQRIKARQHAAGLEDLDQALQLHPASQSGLALRAELHEIMGETDLAIADLLDLAEQQRVHGKYAEGLLAVDRVLRLDRDQLQALDLRGRLLLDLDRPAEARQAFEQAAQLGEDRADLFDRLSRLLVAHFPEEIERAVEWADKAVQAASDDSQRATYIVHRTHCLARALRLLVESDEPDIDLKALPVLGRILDPAEEVEWAYATRLAELREREPGEELEVMGPDQFLRTYYYLRGQIHQNLDHLPEARLDLEKAIELGEENADLYNRLSWLYAEQLQIEFVRAQQLAQRALELAGEDRETRAVVLGTLGWTYHQLGEYEQAVRYLEQAVELDPEIVDNVDYLERARRSLAEDRG